VAVKNVVRRRRPQGTMTRWLHGCVPRAVKGDVVRKFKMSLRGVLRISTGRRDRLEAPHKTHLRVR